MFEIFSTLQYRLITTPIMPLESEEFDIGLQNIVIRLKYLHTPVGYIECDKK